MYPTVVGSVECETGVVPSPPAALSFHLGIYHFIEALATWGGIIIAIAPSTETVCLRMGPVVVRLAGMALEREREHNHCHSTAGMHPCNRVKGFFPNPFGCVVQVRRRR